MPSTFTLHSFEQASKLIIFYWKNGLNGTNLISSDFEPMVVTKCVWVCEHGCECECECVCVCEHGFECVGNEFGWASE